MKLTAAGLRRIIFEERRRLMEEDSGGTYNFRLGRDFQDLMDKKEDSADEFARQLGKIVKHKGQDLSGLSGELKERIKELPHNIDDEINLLVFGSWDRPEVERNDLLPLGRVKLRGTITDDNEPVVYIYISNYNISFQDLESVVWNDRSGGNLYDYLISVEPDGSDYDSFELYRIDDFFESLGDKVVVLN